MVNGREDRYSVPMDKDEYKAALAEYAAIGDARAANDAEREALSERANAAVIEGLERGIKPADLARSLRYTDGYIRKLGRANGIKADPRYADLKPPSRSKHATEPVVEERNPVSEPVIEIENGKAEVYRLASTIANGPVPLPARSTETVEAREQRLVGDLRKKYPAWFSSVWIATEGLEGRERSQAILAKAVEDGHLTQQQVERS